jgi:hypothetical protein
MLDAGADLRTICASPAAVMGADNPQATKAIVSDLAPTDKRPMVIQNPDGTMTIQKEPPKEAAKDTKAKNGLVIPPQVVVPTIPSLLIRPTSRLNHR